LTIVYFFDRMITIKHNKKCYVCKKQGLIIRLDFAKVEKAFKALTIKALKSLLKHHY